MALHRDIATITSISTSDQEATAKLWGLFGHDASTLLQIVISAVPADLNQRQRDAGKQHSASQSSCSAEEVHIVEAVLHLPDSCAAGCTAQIEVSHWHDIELVDFRAGELVLAADAFMCNGIIQGEGRP